MRGWSLNLLAAVAIPLSSDSGWQVLQFNRIPPNASRFSAEGLTIKVNGSASPLVYKLAQPVRARGFTAEIELSGDLRPAAGFPEDAYLRIGLIVPGGRRLNWVQRQTAADWVSKLFQLAPPGGGIDKVYFFNLVANAGDVGLERILPGSSDLILERNAAVRTKNKDRQTFAFMLPQPLTVAGVWLGSDGDNTKSAFELRLKSLALNTAD